MSNNRSTQFDNQKEKSSKTQKANNQKSEFEKNLNKQDPQ